MNFGLAVFFASILTTSYGMISSSNIGDQRLDAYYQDSRKEELMDAPVSFLPICKPLQFHQFSEQQIRCACGLTCRFVCKPNGNAPPSHPGAEGKPNVCRRICMQKPCYRPLEYRIYDYKLMGGLCQRWKACTYRAKCEGNRHRWINYKKLGCQPAMTYGGGYRREFD